MHQVVQGVKLQENGWVLLLQDLWEHVFIGKKLKKMERAEENYITSLSTLKSRFICQRKKTMLEVEFQEFSLRLIVFVVYWT